MGKEKMKAPLYFSSPLWGEDYDERENFSG